MKAGTLASEPFTAAATLTLATPASSSPSAGSSKHWLREADASSSELKLVAAGFEQSDEAGKALAES